MGWLSFYKNPSESPHDCLLRRCFTNEETRVVGHSTNGTTHFFAVHYPASFLAKHWQKANETYVLNADGSFIGCVCFLTRRDKGYYNFAYKDMGETAGPYVYCKSLRFLKLLSPLTDNPCSEYARNWRKHSFDLCAEKPLKFKPNDVIMFDSPIKFRDGINRQKFTVTGISRFRKGKLLVVKRFVGEDGAICKLSSRLLKDAKKVA